MAELSPWLLKVHPASKKILLHEYQEIDIEGSDGAGICIPRADLTTSFLRASDLRTITELTDEIWILAKPSVLPPAEYGFALYSLHMDQMCRFIYAQVNAKCAETIGAYPAMLQWYDLYGIDDNDYGYDAAYKRWQRWIDKGEFGRNLSESAHYSPNRVLRDVRFGIDEAFEILGCLMRKHPALFFTKYGVSNVNIRRALMAILRRKSTMTNTEISSEMGIHYTRVNRNIASWNKILAGDARALRIYEELIM